MQASSYRELKVLEELASDSTITQRRLAEKLQVALGLTNLMIRRFVKKGYVKAVSLQKNRIRYLLTPKGIAEKTRLTYEYLEYSLFLYRRVRHVLKETLTQIAHTGGRQIVVLGTGEIAEIAYLTLQELGLSLVAVVDDGAAGTSFLGQPVLGLEALPTLTFDCGIVSDLDHAGLDGLGRRLRTLGVPESKIVIIEHERTTIRALPGGVDQLALTAASAVSGPAGVGRRC